MFNIRQMFDEIDLTKVQTFVVNVDGLETPAEAKSLTRKQLEQMREFTQTPLDELRWAAIDGLMINGESATELYEKEEIQKVLEHDEAPEFLIFDIGMEVLDRSGVDTQVHAEEVELEKLGEDEQEDVDLDELAINSGPDNPISNHM